ncbi:predicted protein [Naegleria gruberi]|uniref:Predicted protein n=1 Tax=Naegleria gruberi TaxID=5762 RepID=D2W3J0_NAEGR|nr:uncharacterized protein NAEGRDRAFT_75958 [Naegleria gruberi]EFC36340.1 predicted protein [Naegleria gruberi]|eukprot:XP_002669084.1 predicted protein [Naegleria gruberi strain NEG-M]
MTKHSPALLSLFITTLFNLFIITNSHSILFNISNLQFNTDQLVVSSNNKITFEQFNLSEHFQNCSGISKEEILFSNGGVMFGAMESFTPQFSCQKVHLYRQYEIPRFFNNWWITSVSQSVFETSERYELCEKVHNWEVKLNFTSNHAMSELMEYYSVVQQFILENSSISYNDWLNQKNITFQINNISNFTNKETTLHDWINYWRLCKSANKNLQLLNNDTSGYLQQKSLLYCGSIEFGIPILMSRGFICHCVVNDYFSGKCNGNLSFYRSVIGFVYSTLSIGGIGIIISFFIVFLPKLVSSIKTRKLITLNSIIINIIAMTIGFSNLLSIYLTGYNPANSMVESAILILCALALFLWLLKNLRMVLYIKNRQYPSYIKWIYIATYCCCFILIAVFLPLLERYYQAQLPVYLSLAVVLIVSFLVFSLIVYIVMRRSTDVNIIKSSFVKYLLFIIGFIIVLSAVWYSGTGWGAYLCANYLLVFSLCFSISYMEFEKEEFDFLFNIKRCGKSKTKQQTKSNEMLQSFLTISEKESNSSSTSTLE